MAQIKAEYEAVAEFETLAKGLVNKYPGVFSDIDLSKIKCVGITNKERKDGKRMWDVKPVPMPVKMDCPFSYYLVVFMNDWVEMDETRRLLLVADALLSIPDEDDNGKIIQPDMKDFSLMLRTFGVDYMDKSGAPNLLKDKVDWKK